MSEQNVIAKVPFESMQSLYDQFMAVFPQERDGLWPHLPEIRRQLEALDIYSEDEHPLPGYIVLPPDVMGMLGEVIYEVNGMRFDSGVHDAAQNMRQAEASGTRIGAPNAVTVSGHLVSVIHTEAGAVDSILLGGWSADPDLDEHRERFQYSTNALAGWVRVYVTPEQYAAMAEVLVGGHPVQAECDIDAANRVLVATRLTASAAVLA